MALYARRSGATGRQCSTAELHPKKVGAEETEPPGEKSAIQADRHIYLARFPAAEKARNSAISCHLRNCSATVAKGSVTRGKGASRPPSGGVDRKRRQWHSAATGHAMTVAVGDGRGFSSLAAAPDGRAPARCTVRSWPGPIPALKPPARARSRAPEHSTAPASAPIGTRSRAKPRRQRRTVRCGHRAAGSERRSVRPGPSPGLPRRSKASGASTAPASGKSSSYVTPLHRFRARNTQRERVPVKEHLHDRRAMVARYNRKRKAVAGRRDPVRPRLGGG